ncbi:MAG TPA: hypothetical protein VNJ29_02875, partial [Candidatus Nitrosotenuis sp.]|nr:hypothetical protein [Candidatus Nitrosotenuis sp.]
MLLKFLTAVLFSTICLSPPTTAMEQTAIEIAPSHPSLPTIYSEIFEGIFQDFIQIPEIPFVKRTYEEKQKLHDRLNKEFLPSFIEASRLGYEEALKTLTLDTITILHQYAQMPPLRAFLTELKTHRQTFPNFLRQSLQQQDHLETIPKTATFSYLIGQLAQFKEIYDSHKHAILANAHKTVSQSEVTQKLISFIKETPTSDLATDVRKLLPTLPASEQDNIITTLTEISNLPAKNWESVPVYLAIKFGHLLWDGKFAEDDWQNVLINQAVQYQDILENFLTNVL